MRGTPLVDGEILGLHLLRWPHASRSDEWALHDENRNSLKSERSLADAGAQLAAIVRGFGFLQFFGERFFRAWFADGGHGFDLEVIRDLELGPGAVVIEALHAVDDEALAESLQSEIFPGGTAIIGMGDGRFTVVIEILPRNEDDEDSGVLGPGFVYFHQ